MADRNSPGRILPPLVPRNRGWASKSRISSQTPVFPRDRGANLSYDVQRGDNMSKSLIHWLTAIVTSLFLLQPAVAAEAFKGPLVSAQWLEKNLKSNDVLLIDAQFPRMHAAAHIPGAVNVDVFTFGGRDLSAAEMEKVIQSWGVSAGKKIVIYDQGGTYLATSLYFDLYYHGFPAKDLVLLDGGLAKWKEAGGAITKDPTPAPKPGTFRVAKVKEEARVRLPEFLVASGDPANSALVEALDPTQHFGAAKFFDRPGHIPNAIMMPTADFYNAEKTFKSPEHGKQMLAYIGIKPDQQVYTHCGGGIAASVPFFAAKFMLDYPKVKLYKESQLEWLRDDRGLPFWTYDAPNMTREKAWLSGWSNQMLRMFGVSKLSVVDVRPEASFKQSHVPFAINVPAEVFKRNLATPAKLAEILGAAGVDAGFEAVIVSDGGLNPDSALAFLMLEKLGQKRISVFSESVDDWGFAGFPLDKEADAADPKKAAARGMFIRPTTYPVNLRPGIMVSDPLRTQRPLSKYYLASSKTIPTKIIDGR